MDCFVQLPNSFQWWIAGLGGGVRGWVGLCLVLHLSGTWYSEHKSLILIPEQFNLQCANTTPTAFLCMLCCWPLFKVESHTLPIVFMITEEHCGWEGHGSEIKISEHVIEWNSLAVQKGCTTSWLQFHDNTWLLYIYFAKASYSLYTGMCIIKISELLMWGIGTELSSNILQNTVLHTHRLKHNIILQWHHSDIIHATCRQLIIIL